MLRVLVGENEEFDFFDEALSAPPFEIDWVVPKNSIVGDDVTFFFWDQGFVASGVVATPPRTEFDNGKKSFRGKISGLKKYAQPIPLDFVEAALPEWGWVRMRFKSANTPSNAGPDIEDRLRELLRSGPPPYWTIAEDDTKAVLPDEIDEDLEVWEGALREIFVNSYERSKEAREACLRFHGTKCVVCDIDFAKTYGPSVAGLIHVHHLTPLSSIGSEYSLNPTEDLRPVCPNCHAVIHYKRDVPLTIAEARELLASNRRVN